MRPECGEQKTIGESCSAGRRSVNGGVNSASIEARSPACMSIREDFEPLWNRDTIKMANPAAGVHGTLPSAGRPVHRGSGPWRGRVWVERGAISLLVYQIGARFLGHRALALVLQCCVAKA